MKIFLGIVYLNRWIGGDVILLLVKVEVRYGDEDIRSMLSYI